jgi:hypothetical protein
MQVLRRIVGRPVVSAIGLAGVLMVAGCAGNSSSSSTNATATPTFNPGAGSYNTSQTVTIADATSGAVLYCTTDGTTPTTSSPQCSQPTTVFKTEFLQAIAVAPGKAPSAVAAAGYTINLNAAATPTFSPAGGSYTSAQTVAINDATSGANIYYTTDGTVPTASATLYTGPVSVPKSTTLSTIAIASGFANSGVASASYVIGTGTATPVISPSGGTFGAAQLVTITDATSGANIYYTIDGSTPTTSSMPYSAPINVSTSETIKAIATASGSSSSIASASFTINVPSAATPIFSPAPGTYATAQTVALSDTTPGAAIYYTTDGSNPTTASTPYGAPISVSTSETIKAIATASGFGASAVASGAYTINIPAAAPPVFSPAAGTYTSAQTVILSDTTSGATIYYTIDGSNPTTSSTPYTNPINVTSSETIKAIATASGFGTSAVASAAYVLNLPVATPTFSPAAGTYSAAQAVTISDTTSGATIYYTTDGTTPTTSSTKYTAPFTVSATGTLQAIAVVGSTTSSVATAAYTINLGPTFSGTVFSGTLPVNGAQVQMYAAGQTGYGSSATALLTTAMKTDASGAFTLVYNCPASPGDLVYLVATGGSTGSGGSNSSLALMAALGSCTSLTPTTKVVVNEVTTVASVYALSPFMTGATNVGAAASAASYQGLTNAFKTVGNLVDLTSGKALDHTPAYSTNLAGDPNILNNSTVPQSRINTLANALNACAANGSGCSSLFSAATPTSGTAPSDTLQAILNIAQNPGTNASMVFNVASVSPFTPVLSAAPKDWTLALTFTGGGLGFAPGVQVPFADGTNNKGQFLNTAMTIDATGNIWVTGFNSYGSGAGTPDVSSGMIAEFSNLGAPLTSVSSLNASGSVVTFGGYIPIKQGGGNGGTVAPIGLAIDPSGNAWVVGGSGLAGGSPFSSRMSEISAALSLTVPDIPLSYPPSAIAIDNAGNVWLGGGALEEFRSDGTIGLGPDGGANPPLSPYGYSALQQLIFDSKATSLWASDTAGLGQLFQIDPVHDTATVDYSIPFGTTGFQYTPLVAGSDDPTTGNPGNVYGCGNAGGQTLDVFNVSSTSILASYPIQTGRGCGNQMVMDGANHIFTITGSPSPGIVDEFTVTSSGITPVSPVTTGYTGTSSGESPTINPDPNAPIRINNGSGVSTAGVAGAGIDGSGNLWVLNADTGTTSSRGNVLVEYVGIAAPVVTPMSVALANGQVGVRP